jgi:hypothetical protein
MKRFYKTRHIFLSCSERTRLSSVGTSATIWPVVTASDDDDDDECGAVGGMIGKGKQTTTRKSAPVPTSFTTNPTLPNSGLGGGKPAINGLSYAMAIKCV